MKTEFKTKFLQHLMDKKEQKGFTLIELLVVIIIIGILSAIALPSFLNQANKAKESEGKLTVGTCARGQQAFFVEKTAFTTTWDRLGSGIATQSENYTYSVFSADTAVSVICLADSRNTDTLRSFAAGVQVAQTPDGETTTKVEVCQTIDPGPASTDAIIFVTSGSTGDPTCNEDAGWGSL